MRTATTPTLDREIRWETPAGKQVLIKSRRLVSFANRHVAAISYNVTLLNAAASLVISSEMAADAPSTFTDANDPRQTRIFAGRVLHHRTSYAKDRRIVLCHATEKSRLTLICATDHSLETSCPHAHKVSYTEDFGQVAFTTDARPDYPIHPTKYMAYHTSQTASAEELCGRAEWTLDRVTTHGFQQLLSSQEQYMDDFWRRSDVRIRDIREERTKRSTVERSSKQSASTSFTSCRPQRAPKTRVCPRRASPARHMRGITFGTPRPTCCRF
jgi:alpha,alpha-trehalose phosphorylase